MSLIYLYIAVGGFIGGVIPSLFGADITSIWSVITTAIGSFVGIWLYRRMDLE